MSKLSFPARRLLVLYRKFYGNGYPSATGNNQNVHVKTQKMFYLLGLSGACVGNYGFVWDQFGPYCEAIQDLARELDTKAADVEAFYDEYPSGLATDKKFFTDNADSESLFRSKDLDIIEKARHMFDIKDDYSHLDRYGDTNMRRWTELLGSIAYISQSMLPGAEKSQLVDKLKTLKDKYQDVDEIEKALQTLENLGMLTCVRV